MNKTTKIILTIELLGDCKPLARLHGEALRGAVHNYFIRQATELYEYKVSYNLEGEDKDPAICMHGRLILEKNCPHCVKVEDE